MVLKIIFLLNLLILCFFSSNLYSQEVDKEDSSKKKFKIETTLPSERVLTPKVGPNDETDQIILIPPK